MSGIETVTERVARILRASRAGLVTDIDGTISRITWPPETARVEPGALAALEHLVDRLAVVAVVSGRSVGDAYRLVGSDRLEYVGNHGLEWRRGDRVESSEIALRFRPILEEAAQAVERSVRVPGLAIEDKRLSLAIHVRSVADPRKTEADLLAALEPLAERHALRITRGRMVVEVRPPVDVNKGTALRDIVTRHELDAVVFIGDDTTDVDAMKSLRQLRSAGPLSGLSIGVLGPETPAAVRDESDLAVEGVDGVVDLLGDLVKQLGPRGQSESSG